MSNLTYYVDPASGDDAHDGLSPEYALKNWEGRAFAPGDSVLIKRGAVVRGVLRTTDGAPGAPITYGAYGNGEKPLFLGSASAGDAAEWVLESPNLWRFQGRFPSEVCNLIFDGGKSCGNLRWALEDLDEQGEWFFTGLGSRAESGTRAAGRAEDSVLYLFSTKNPGEYYSSIECALWGERQLVRAQHHVVLEDLAFHNSGVHGYQAVRASDITIRDCDFRFIGGAVWDAKLKIRFGNAVEFWDGATDCLVERCVFDNIYDSGVTHQGGPESDTPERLIFRNNFFVDNGMSAYECRGPAAREVYFEHNVSYNAGGGFSMQGETPPRQSEIYPQPMGHHVFIWLIAKGTQTGPVFIRHNVFSEAPYGSAIYSIIDPEDERQFIIDENRYWQTTGTNLMHFGGKDYTPAEFQLYQKETGQDQDSRIADPETHDPA